MKIREVCQLPQPSSAESVDVFFGFGSSCKMPEMKVKLILRLSP